MKIPQDVVSLQVNSSASIKIGRERLIASCEQTVCGTFKQNHLQWRKILLINLLTANGDPIRDRNSPLIFLHATAQGH